MSEVCDKYRYLVLKSLYNMHISSGWVIDMLESIPSVIKHEGEISFGQKEWQCRRDVLTCDILPEGGGDIRIATDMEEPQNVT